MALICLCHGVSDRAIRGCVIAGARSIDEVGRSCKAGTSCAGCHDVIEEILETRVDLAGTRTAAA